MIKIENISVYGFQEAIRGMRNPLNSWSRSDSSFDNNINIGQNDLNLMKRLFKAGNEHRKYDRMISIYMDIEASHTWWAEFDTYKIGTVRNSCSKMHKIHSIEFIRDQFDHEGIDEVGGRTVEVHKAVIEELERLRCLFNETKEKKYWRAIIELLPMGFRLRATIMMNYEVAANIIRQRSGHKVDEWHVLVDTLRNLPYMEQLLESLKDE